MCVHLMLFSFCTETPTIKRYNLSNYKVQYSNCSVLINANILACCCLNPDVMTCREVLVDLFTPNAFLLIEICRNRNLQEFFLSCIRIIQDLMLSVSHRSHNKIWVTCLGLLLLTEFFCVLWCTIPLHYFSSLKLDTSFSYYKTRDTILKRTWKHQQYPC